MRGNGVIACASSASESDGRGERFGRGKFPRTGEFGSSAVFAGPLTKTASTREKTLAVVNYAATCPSPFIVSRECNRLIRQLLDLTVQIVPDDVDVSYHFLAIAIT